MNTKTFMAKTETVERKWYLIDAANIPLGRVASQVANMIHGKNKPEYTPNADCGDFVVVINSDKMVLTGKKLEQKFHYTHSGYPGNLKATDYKTMMEQKSDEALKIAVKGMLPKNNLARKQIKRLFVYKAAEQPHEAQKPQLIKIKGERE